MDEKLKKAQELYLQGKIDEALPLFQKLADSGNARAMYFLGEIYGNGYGRTKQDIKKATFWRNEGSKNGDIFATLNCAYPTSAEKKVNQTLAKKCHNEILMLALKGDPFAQNEVSDQFLHGFGVEKDIDYGIYWLKQAAKQGFWRPIFKLGDIYLAGDLVEKDEEKALEYLEIAINMNIKEAKAILAIYYLNKGDEEHIQKGLELADKAIKDGDIGLLYVKGFLCLHGYIKDEDGKKAFEYMKASADYENPFGMKYLGDCYEQGIGTKIDLKKAFKLHKKAAELGHGDAMFQVAKSYENGTGTKKDIKNAIKFYTKAFENGTLEAAYNLGLIYYSGKEILPNFEIAINWFQKGAEKGHVPSMFFLGVCLARGAGVEKNKDAALFWLYQAYLGGEKESLHAIKEYLNITIQ